MRPVRRVGSSASQHLEGGKCPRRLLRATHRKTLETALGNIVLVIGAFSLALLKAKVAGIESRRVTSQTAVRVNPSDHLLFKSRVFYVFSEEHR